jgi:hypothetical protein
MRRLRRLASRTAAAATAAFLAVNLGAAIQETGEVQARPPVVEHPTGCAVTWLGNGGRAGPCSYFQGSLAVVVFCTDAYGNGANYYGPRIYTNGTSTRYCPWDRRATYVGTSRTGH